MNSNQRKVLIGVIVAIVAMLLYPPYNYLGRAGIVLNAGYSWIFDAPRRVSTVNVGLLSIQCVLVAFVGAILYFVLKDKN
jgi:high-affinity nickel permease